MALAIPSLVAPALHSLSSQVGGHPGVLASEDNALVIKPCLPREKAFYELLAQGSTPALEVLRDFVPRFYGTLKLEGKAKENVEGSITGVEPIADAKAEEKDELIRPIYPLQNIVLENIAARFTKPNVLDIKLGTVLYDEDASPEKKARMEETARKTTSAETGVRLTGFQVYDNTTKEYVVTPKSYGKSIRPGDLPEGIRKFFPSSTSTSSIAPSTGSVENPGLPSEYLQPILTGVLDDIRTMRDALKALEIRMVAASFLVVYEGDEDIVRAAAREVGETKEEVEDDQTEDEGDDSDEEPNPVYAVKLIDFAHTKLAPGGGPDEGLLQGVETVVQLFEDRLREVEKEIDEDI